MDSVCRIAKLVGPDLDELDQNTSALEFASKNMYQCSNFVSNGSSISCMTGALRNVYMFDVERNRLVTLPCSQSTVSITSLDENVVLQGCSDGLIS